MSTLFQLDWQEIFVPTLHIGEIILRGSVVYLFIFFVFRVLRREAGAIGISDLLVVLEGEGNISVIPKDATHTRGKDERKAVSS